MNMFNNKNINIKTNIKSLLWRDLGRSYEGN